MNVLAATVLAALTSGLSVASGLTRGLSGNVAMELANTVSLRDALSSAPLLLTLATNIAGFALMQGPCGPAPV